MPGIMIVNGVTFPMSQIADICRRYGAAKLSLFGSIPRDDFHAGSDVDLLVEFAPTTRIGLIGVARMESELSQAIGRRADLPSAGDLSRYFREEVLAGARLLHAA
jgi:predicted nucleotidyltransferase